MFQSFTGSTRRPRQVNLSGQTQDPFAASSWAPSAAGARNTVKIAQQERLLRQRERERLNATRTIQRAWRGHRSRKCLAAERRQDWDGLHIDILTSASSLGFPGELRLLLAFFDFHKTQDIDRLYDFSDRLLGVGAREILEDRSLYALLPRLVDVLLAALARIPPKSRALLLLLVIVLDTRSKIIESIAKQYYKSLAELLPSQNATDLIQKDYIRAVTGPLLPGVEGIDSTCSNSAYKAFGCFFLSSPHVSSKIISTLGEVIDLQRLSQALAGDACLDTSQLLPDHGLWLLANLISIRRAHHGPVEEASYMRALSALLSLSAGDIVGRVDIEDSQLLPDTDDDGENMNHLASPLPKFVREQLSTLVDEDSIKELPAKFYTDESEKSLTRSNVDSSSLASYVLVLLRIFPKSAEQIRMWLYRGTVSLPGDKFQMPAIKLFWRAMSGTNTFSSVSNDPGSALGILRSNLQSVPGSDLVDTRTNDWRAILLFLELYAFVLRFTDDEEFLNGGSASIESTRQSVSSFGQSALPLSDVKALTIFLKNLSFAMFYNAAELSEPDRRESWEGGLGSYFSTGSRSFVPSPGSRSRSESKKSIPKLDFLGIIGMTFDYVRGIVTRVMRMLYERDSRRRFLPTGHWLMTSRFDMEGFIPAVVAEEERRRQITEEDHDVEDDEYDDGNRANGIIGNSRSRAQMRFESMRRQQQKVARRNMLASVGPRLEILQNMPFAIPFDTRVQIFRQFVHQDQLRRRGGTVEPDHWRMSVMHAQGFDRRSERDPLSRHHAKIRRDNLFEDAFDQFYDLGDGLKEPIQITFVDQFDAPEAGIDGGGVTKEFLTSVTKEAFGTTNGEHLFVSNDQNLLYPNPSILDERRSFLQESGLPETGTEFQESVNDILRKYEFLGRVVGKCLYEGILVDISFAGFFLLKWASDGSGLTSRDASYLANINDLRELDEDLYQGLMKLKNYSGNVEDFSVDFTITDTLSASSPSGTTNRNITRDLLPNGASMPVTNENRVLYVSLVASHKLHLQPRRQTRAFLRGLGEIINPTWLSMFNQTELQTLIGGDSSEIDVQDLRRHTQYSGVYQIGDDGLEHPTIGFFWEVMSGLDDGDRRKVLKYVTSTPRAPLLGFSQLNPRFSIRDAGGDEQRLPSTSTCINLLKLPRYSTSTLLRQKLLYAINSGAGFDLS